MPQYPSNVKTFIERMGAKDFVDALDRFRRITRGNPRVWERFYTHHTDAMTPQQKQAYEAWLALRNRGTVGGVGTQFDPKLTFPTRPTVQLENYDPTQTAPNLEQMENTAWGLHDYWTAIKHYGQYLNPIGLVFRELPRFLTNVLDGYNIAAEKYSHFGAWSRLPFWQQMAVAYKEGVDKYWAEDRQILQFERWMTRRPLSEKMEHWGNKIQNLWYEPLSFMTSVFGSMTSKLLYSDDNRGVGEIMLDSFRRSQGVGRTPALKPRGIEMLGEALEAQHGEGSFFSTQSITYRDREGRLITERVPINYIERYQRLQETGDIKIEQIHDDIVDSGLTVQIGGVKFHALYTPLETLEFIGNPINWAYRPVKVGMGIAKGGLKGLKWATQLYREGNRLSKIEMILNSPITVGTATAMAPFMQAGRVIGAVGKPLSTRIAPALQKASPVFDKFVPILRGAANIIDNISANLLPSHYIPEEYFIEGFNAERTLKWWEYMTQAAKQNAFDPKNGQQAAEFMLEAKQKFDRVQAQMETIRRLQEVGEDATDAVRRLGDLLDDALRYSDQADEAKKLADALRKTGKLQADELTQIQKLIGQYMGDIPVIVQNVFSRGTRWNLGKNWAKAWVRSNAFIQKMSNSRVGRFLFPAYRFADPRGVAAEQFTRLFKNALMGRANELREVVGDLALAFSGSDDYRNTKLFRLNDMLEAKEMEALSEVGIQADRRTEFVEETNDLLRDVGFKPSIFGEVRTPGMEPVSGVNKQLENFLQQITDGVKSVEIAVKRGVDAEEAALSVAETIHRIQPQFSVPDLKAKLMDGSFRRKWLYLTEGNVSFTGGERFQEYWGALATVRRLGLSRSQLRELTKTWEVLNQVLGSAPDGVKLRQELGELMLNIANNQVYRPEDVVSAVERITAGKAADVKAAVEASILSYLNIRKQATISFSGYTKQLAQLEAVKKLNEEISQRRRIVEDIMQKRLQVSREQFHRRGCL